ncbi:unnamed protein product [Protopolystoma xenopodis]|uniref:Uncharacterized protein n=1 Tax=Protopolystoma xenopodis TaxID=117903 RepID=A0A448XHU8_9PLAT|nr:unnamed protein product [Protopolystoma xenopodis]
MCQSIRTALKPTTGHILDLHSSQPSAGPPDLTALGLTVQGNLAWEASFSVHSSHLSANDNLYCNHRNSQLVRLLDTGALYPTIQL